MKSVLLRLREYYNQCSPTETEIVTFILENPKKAVECNIHELSDITFSSPSSIIRLCKKINFDGYKELRRELIYELATFEHTASVGTEEITQYDAIEAIAQKVTYKNAKTLDETLGLLDYDTLTTCVDLLCKAKTVYFFGLGSSLLVAKDAHMKFLRLNKSSCISEDWHLQLLEARNMTVDDLGIAISYSGQTLETIECAKAAKNVDAPVISITRYGPNPLTAICDHNIYVSATESLFRNGAMASRIAQLNIIDIIYTAFANRSYEKSLEKLVYTHIDKPSQEVVKPNLTKKKPDIKSNQYGG